jgi:hypothetical protein
MSVPTFPFIGGTTDLRLPFLQFITNRTVRYLFFVWQFLLILTVLSFGTLTCALGILVRFPLSFPFLLLTYISPHAVQRRRR